MYNEEIQFFFLESSTDPYSVSYSFELTCNWHLSLLIFTPSQYKIY